MRDMRQTLTKSAVYKTNPNEKEVWCIRQTLTKRSVVYDIRQTLTKRSVVYDIS